MAFIHDKNAQSVYDCYNEFMFSSDEKVLAKLISKTEFINMVEDVPGDIVELGVFKGSGFVAWLKLMSIISKRKRKVIGFDMFDAEALVADISTSDKDVMASLFEDRGFDPSGYEFKLESIVKQAGFDNYELIKGNVFDTVGKFVDHRPGFRPALINFDLDLAEPTFYCLEKLYPVMPKGGIAIFDEYALHEWTESNAVDEFCGKHGIKLHATNYSSPAAYFIKD